MHHFGRALLTALLIGTVILAVQKPLISAALALLGASAEVHRNALVYCTIRIWSAPAAFANYTILGYLLGKQRAAPPAAASGNQHRQRGPGSDAGVTLALGSGRHRHRNHDRGMGRMLSRLGTHAGHRRRPSHVRWSELVDGPSLRRLFALNRDILLRTLSLVAAYVWFTRTGARSGNAILAANAVLINFLWIAGYGLDGFANATEALVGEAIGARRLADFRAVLKASSVSAFTVAARFPLSISFSAATSLLFSPTRKRSARSPRSIFPGWSSCPWWRCGAFCSMAFSSAPRAPRSYATAC